MNWRTIFDHLIKNWKTTAVGLISSAVIVIVAIQGVPQGAKPIAYTLAVLRALLGIIQKD